MAKFFTYGKAYDGKIVPFLVTKELLEIRKQGYFDIKPSKNVKRIEDTSKTDFRDPAHYLSYNGSKVAGFINIQ